MGKKRSRAPTADSRGKGAALVDEELKEFVEADVPAEYSISEGKKCVPSHS